MSFARRAADRWHREVPGARWFKADLHIHTIDDHPGKRAKLPDGIPGPPEAQETIDKYAHAFLQGAVRQGVQVLGITPHSPRIGQNPETSAVWRIVEKWTNGSDDDGHPFREKIYAVFPGFEPSFKQGSYGLHLLFLFDPEIGRDRYLKAFDLIMGGVSPWQGQDLQISSRSADDAFDEMREFHRRESGKPDGIDGWHYMVLAPHVDSRKGLLDAQKAQVLEHFEHGEVAGLELGDNKLPTDTVTSRPWLSSGMAKHRQAFFHGSDAYSLDKIGERHTWVKLATPRIEGLRQAFIADDSRIRIAYTKDADGNLTEIPDPPDVTVHDRAWLKSVVITGGASFFAADRRNETPTRFDLSPDLTCIIGGSMTGKSTFLDGLRVRVGAEMPTSERLKSQVKARGGNIFLAGSPAVELECPGQDPTAPAHTRWPAVFYTQNELQRIAQEPGAVEGILARLASPDEFRSIEGRKRDLRELDRELRRVAKHLAKLDEDLEDAEQAYERSKKATDELARVADAGIDDLRRASRDVYRWQEFASALTDLGTGLAQTQTSVKSLELPNADDSFGKKPHGLPAKELERLHMHWSSFRDSFSSTDKNLSTVVSATKSIVKILQAREHDVRKEVNRRLAAAGLDGAKINEFQALNRQAAFLTSYRANFDQKRQEHDQLGHRFQTLLADRREKMNEQRNAFDRIIKKISTDHDDRILARRIDNGDQEPLEGFLREWKRRGITRWLNETKPHERPGPSELLAKADEKRLADVGMSPKVQKTFEDDLSVSRRRDLAALRCPDHYVIELRVGDGGYRPLDNLSGGQRVSVLLALLLETKDSRPLVVDQPEDELDNRFLFETVLPALKRLKGRRQIIIATHNANIVVNGDADQVIQLEATAKQGRVARAGAIEEPAVRDAIVRTVDGGDEAFRLRRLKYGF